MNSNNSAPNLDSNPGSSVSYGWQLQAFSIDATLHGGNGASKSSDHWPGVEECEVTFTAYRLQRPAHGWDREVRIPGSQSPGNCFRRLKLKSARIF